MYKNILSLFNQTLMHESQIHTNIYTHTHTRAHTLSDDDDGDEANLAFQDEWASHEDTRVIFYIRSIIDWRRMYEGTSRVTRPWGGGGRVMFLLYCKHTHLWTRQICNLYTAVDETLYVGVYGGFSYPRLLHPPCPPKEQKCITHVCTLIPFHSTM